MKISAFFFQSIFGLYYWVELLSGEVILTYATQGALEILGQVLPLRAGGNSVVGIAELLVIFPSTYITYILCHCFFSFL